MGLVLELSLRVESLGTQVLVWKALGQQEGFPIVGRPKKVC